jgi:hypothetical protein
MKRPDPISLLLAGLLVAALPATAADFDQTLFANLLGGVLADMTSPNVGTIPGVVEVVGRSSVDSGLVKALNANLAPLHLSTHTTDFRSAAGDYDSYFANRLRIAGRVVCIVAVDLPPELAHTVAEAARQEHILTASPRVADVDPLSLGMHERSGVFYYSQYELVKEGVAFRVSSWPGTNREQKSVHAWTSRPARIELMKSFEDAMDQIEHASNLDDVRDAARTVERLLSVHEKEEKAPDVTTSWTRTKYLPHYALAMAFVRLQNCDAASDELERSQIALYDPDRYRNLKSQFDRNSCRVTAPQLTQVAWW